MKSNLIFVLMTITFMSNLRGQDQLGNSKINYSLRATKSCCDIIYSDTTGNEYLRKFRKQYRLTERTDTLSSTLNKAIAILHWTHQQWQHNGGNPAGTDDAFKILEKAGNGEGFRCTEYAVVFTTALASLNIPARILNLKTKNAETASSGAGHTIAEAYINELDKWVLFDPQSDLVTYEEQKPLNAVELKHLANYKPQAIKVFFKKQWGSDNLCRQVTDWYKPYLYFFDIRFDNRYGNNNTYKCHGKDKLFLVPIGENAPKVFQKKYPLTGFAQTSSIADFYQHPVLTE